MGWFFLIGLALSLLLAYLHSATGSAEVFVGTLVVLMVWSARRKVKEGEGRRLIGDEIEETGRLLALFHKESNVLLSKLKGGEKISAEAAEHHKETYDRVLPLAKKHGWRLDSVRKEEREEEGDYSGDHIGIEEAVEKMFKAVRSGIDGQATLQALPEKLLNVWESQYSFLLGQVNSDEVAPQELTQLFELLSKLSTKLFPLLPDSQAQQLQGKLLDLTKQFKTRSARLAETTNANG